MSDMITAEGPEELAARMERHDWVPIVKAGAAMIRSLHAQLADAKAAQALVVERAAEVMDQKWFIEDSMRDAIKAEIRALADTDGLALVQALRAERDEYKKLAIAGNLVALEMRTVEADRDRLAAANAALEAQVARLVRVERERDAACKVADGYKADFHAALDAAAPDNDDLRTRLTAAEAQVGALRSAVTDYHLALDRRENGNTAGYRLQDEVQRILEMPWKQGAALAEVQADARREGGE